MMGASALSEGGAGVATEVARRPITAYPRQVSVPCCFMRGGSSRGGFFLEEDLPTDPRARAALLLGCYGAPDARQIDGIGGADPLTSKAAVVGPSSVPGADVDYTFYQVGIDQPRVSTGGTCGNMLAAVGPFALLRGLVEAREPETVIRIHATNTRQILTARIPVADGMPAVEGDCRIAGVPGAGGRITLDFGDCAGAVSGRLLPTGSPRDEIELGGRSIEVSLVDAATPFVFVRAADLGATGTELPEAIVADPRLAGALEAVRGWAARALGLVERAEDARAATPNVPRVMMVSPAAGYRALDGRMLDATSMDLCVRQMAMQRPHKALAVTGAVCAAVAAGVEGTVAASFAASPEGETRLGHPSGVLRVGSRVTRGTDGGYRVESARIERTARLIMAGTLFVSESRLAALRAAVELG